MGLRDDFELVFTSGASSDPYIDPEEVIELFPDASYMEAYEWAIYYTLEVQDLLDLEEGDEIPILAREYIRAAVACALTRIYDWSTTGGGSDVFRLGDLSVENRQNQRTVDDRAGASNWCELAAVLRAELLGEAPKAAMRGVVRGDAWYNPMPDRSLRHVEN